MIEESWADLFVQSFATVIGVFVGASLAYWTERRKEKQIEFKTRAAAVNLATLTLGQMLTALRKYQENVLDPTRNEDSRWCTMRPSDLVAGDLASIDYPALQFLFRSSNPNILSEISNVIRAFVILRQIVGLRSVMHLNELQLAFERSGADDTYSAEAIERAAGPRVTALLREYTDSIVTRVDENVGAIAKLLNDLCAAAQPLVGSETLINARRDVVPSAGGSSSNL